jgi:hypothetical protein
MAKLPLLTAVTLFICGSVGWTETLPYGYLIRCQLGHSDNGTPVDAVVTNDATVAGKVIIAKNSALHFAGSPVRKLGRLQMTGDWTLVDPATAKEYKIKAQVLEGQGKENGMIGINEQEMQSGPPIYLYLLDSFVR